MEISERCLGAVSVQKWKPPPPSPEGDAFPQNRSWRLQVGQVTQTNALLSPPTRTSTNRVFTVEVRQICPPRRFVLFRGGATRRFI